MAESAVRSKGWNLTAEGLTFCSPSDGNRVSAEKIIEAAKNTDLREIGEKWLPDELNRGKCEYVEGPGVLQIQKIRNISAPKEHEESQTAPRMLRLALTDGQQTCNAIEMQRLDRIGLDTPPGTKICIKGTVEVENGFLLLTNKNTVFVGGRVNKLAENWELKKMLAGQSRANVGSEGGPPLFVPFGQRIRDAKGAVQVNKRDNFKSIESNKKEEKTAEEIEFEQQRKATIAEALQAKEESKPKTFGGGTKQVGTDREISRIVEMGFTAEEASRALRQNDNDVTSAINQLLTGRRDFRDRPMSDRGDRRGPQRDFREDRQDNRRDDRRMDRGDDRRDDRRENTRGRGRGRDREDFGEDMGSSRPSGPATLFDFLETKIKPSNDKSSNPQTEKTSSQSSSSSYTKSQNQYSTNQNQRSNESDYGQRYQGNDRDDNPPPKSYHGGRDSRPQTAPAFVSKGQNSQKPSYHNNQNSEKTSTRSNFSSDRGKPSYGDQTGNQKGNNSQNNYNNGQFNGNNSRPENRGGQNNPRGTSNNSGNNNDSSRPSRPVQSQGYNKKDGGSNNQTNSSQNYNTQSGAQNDSRQYGGQSGNKPYGQGENRRYGQGENKPYGQGENKPYGSQNDNRQYGRNDNKQSGQNDSRQYNASQNESRQYGQSESKQYGQSESRHYGGSQSEQYRQDNQPSGGPQHFDSKRNKDFSKGPQNSQPMRQPNQSANQRGNHKKDFQSQPQNFPPPSTASFKKGDPCLAKYWEDNKFYPAVVRALYPDLPTCIVLFPEYGNEEEVNLTDVKPLTMPPSQYLPHPQHPQQQYMDYGGHQQGQLGQDNHINSMEFRRRPARPEPNKPTQAFYQPPSQRN